MSSPNYQRFTTLERLYAEIECDKHYTGAGVAQRNRYPLRFVLFDSFKNFQAFIDECSMHHILVFGMDDWLDDHDDIFISHTALADRFKENVKHQPINDYVIVPFSEMVRFYNNNTAKTFDALIRELRLIEATPEALKTCQRVYVPIIGMRSKMGDFIDHDNNIFIWEYSPDIEQPGYRLVLTNGTTYGVRNLDQRHSVCGNVREWIQLWKNGQVKESIICSSRSIFRRADYAQPDNAFEHVVCNNAYDFLRHGLQLDLGEVDRLYAKQQGTASEPLPDSEAAHWEQLAKEVDATDFSLPKYLAQRIGELTTEKDFVKAWQERHDEHSRWLLCMAWAMQHEGDYISLLLAEGYGVNTATLFGKAATHIFSIQHNDKMISARRRMLEAAKRHGIIVHDEAEKQIIAKLSAIATDPQRSYVTAMRYVSGALTVERQLLVKWLGEQHISRDDVKTLYPDLYHYTTPLAQLTVNVEGLTDNCAWLRDYLTEYTLSKLNNSHHTTRLAELLKEKNGSSVAMNKWMNELFTVKTLLSNRQDIDVYYWIDGLGADWLPLVVNVIESFRSDGIYLNEVKLARALLPSRTETNRPQLETLAEGKPLEKIGDLDAYAHKQKAWPDYVVTEIELVAEAIRSVLQQYAGKKIAFVSDHGITYLAGEAQGLNLGGITADHHGRCAIWDNGSAPSGGDRYMTLNDGKTLCALSHRSLSAKIPKGQGAHGGATPEEVVVPILVVSAKEMAAEFSAQLITTEVSPANPIVRYRIKGEIGLNAPYITYNNKRYALTLAPDGSYTSQRLELTNEARTVTLTVGGVIQEDRIDVRLGVEEDDLFDM